MASAQADTLLSYNALANLSPMIDLTGQDLGGLILTPGVYKFDTSAQLTGGLVLDTLGDPNAFFAFLIGTTLTAASNSTVTTLGGTSCCNVYWQVGSSSTIGTNAEFLGTIIAYTSITLNTRRGDRPGAGTGTERGRYSR